ncbi:MAG: hypothetical protein IT374_07935 [Polyangiaceae bacterium]|nr:hypothetical protein [Polyangiaceae bacterium]
MLTNSEDGTATQLLALGGAVPVVRFNVDLWRDYRVSVRDDGFALTDPTGRAISTDTCAAVYYRKPHWFGAEEGDVAERWARSQVRGVVEHLVNWARDARRLVLVDPADEARVDKLSQLRVARRHFAVPDGGVAWGTLPTPSWPVVAKSLVAAGFLGGRFLFTRRVDPAQLDPAWPWYLQEEHHGEDVTVVFVDGETFAAALDRETFEGEDWRKFISEARPLPWRAVDLRPEETAAIRRFMRDAGLSFGRLDFLRTPEGRLVFLEVTTNGEWGWLDDGDRGIFSAVWRAIERVAAREAPAARG